MKTNLSSNLYLSAQECNEVLIAIVQDYNARYHNHPLQLFTLNYNDNLRIDQITRSLIRQQHTGLTRIIYKYLVQHKLIKVHKYQTQHNHEARITKRILYKFKEISQHFNIHAEPYYSQSDDNSLRFMSNRLAQHIRRFIDKHESTLPETQLNLLTTQLHHNTAREYNIEYDRHFDLTSDGKLTYLARNKPTKLSSNDKWVPDSRTQIKYGKGLRKIAANNAQYMSDQIFETFHNYTFSKFHFTDTFKILQGHGISNGYHGSNYASESGSLNSSCMRYDECQSYLKIYTNNSQISLLVSSNTDNMITGRALIFKTTIDDQPVTIMDRIYGNDKTVQAFKDYANTNNMLHKKEQNYHNSVFVAPNGSLIRENVQIQLDNTTFNSYPYMDTFKYIDWDNNIISTHELDSTNIKCESTQGNYSQINDYDEDYVTLNTGERVPEDDAGYCIHEGEYYHLDYCVWSDHHNTHIITDDAIYIESCSDWYHDQDDIAMDEIRGEYDLIENLEYSEYQDCYYSDYETCLVHGIVHPEEVTLITLENGDQHYIHDDVNTEELHTHLTESDIEYLIASEQIN